MPTARAYFAAELRRADPLESLLREGVESGHGHLEVLLFRVLDPVVADAVETLR
jgi:hypothetical protein